MECVKSNRFALGSRIIGLALLGISLLSLPLYAQVDWKRIGPDGARVNKLFSLQDKLFASIDGDLFTFDAQKRTWSRIHQFPSQSKIIHMVEEGSVLVAMDMNGKTFICTDTGKTWQSRTPLPWTRSGGPVFLHSHKTRLYTAQRGNLQEKAGLWVSQDTGKTWNPIPGPGYPDSLAVRQMVSKGDSLFARTRESLALSADHGLTWKNLPIEPLTEPLVIGFHDGQLYLGTSNTLFKYTSSFESYQVAARVDKLEDYRFLTSTASGLLVYSFVLGSYIYSQVDWRKADTTVNINFNLPGTYLNSMVEYRGRIYVDPWSLGVQSIALGDTVWRAENVGLETPWFENTKFHQGRLYLVSASGITYSSADFATAGSWRQEYDGRMNIWHTHAIETDGNRLFLGVENDGLYKLENGKWETFATGISLSNFTAVRDIDIMGSSVIVGGRSSGPIVAQLQNGVWKLLSNGISNRETFGEILAVEQWDDWMACGSAETFYVRRLSDSAWINRPFPARLGPEFLEYHQGSLLMGTLVGLYRTADLGLTWNRVTATDSLLHSAILKTDKSIYLVVAGKLKRCDPELLVCQTVPTPNDSIKAIDLYAGNLVIATARGAWYSTVNEQLVAPIGALLGKRMERDLGPRLIGNTVTTKDGDKAFGMDGRKQKLTPNYSPGKSKIDFSRSRP